VIAPNKIEERLRKEEKRAKRIDANLEAREYAENGFVMAAMREDYSAMGQYLAMIEKTFMNKSFVMPKGIAE
jgi:hypothetical protein